MSLYRTGGGSVIKGTPYMIVGHGGTDSAHGYLWRISCGTSYVSKRYDDGTFSLGDLTAQFVSDSQTNNRHIITSSKKMYMLQDDGTYAPVDSITIIHNQLLLGIVLVVVE